MPRNPNDVAAKSAADGLWIRLPDTCKEKLERFFVDKSSGNVQLNIQQGQVRKLVIEEHIRD